MFCLSFDRVGIFGDWGRTNFYFLFFFPLVFSPFPLSSAHIYSDVERVYEADAGAARVGTARRKIHSTVYDR